MAWRLVPVHAVRVVVQAVRAFHLFVAVLFARSSGSFGSCGFHRFVLRRFSSRRFGSVHRFTDIYIHYIYAQIYGRQGGVIGHHMKIGLGSVALRCEAVCP